MHYIIKRMTALILSLALMTMVMSSAVLPYALAATYGINFINANDKLITTIVENAVIQAEGTLPPGHAFDSAQPFMIESKDGTPNQEPLFNIKADTTGRYYTITALDGSAGGAPDASGIFSPLRDTVPTTYTLKPKLFADISDGLGMASVNILGQSGITGTRDIGIAVRSKNPMRITSNSRVRLTVKNAETEGVAPTFNVLTQDDVNGAFTSLDGQTPLTDGQEGYQRVGNKRSFKIRFSNDANVYSFDITLNAEEYMQEGTTFEFNYNLQEINSLTLTVITPRMVLENIHTAITTSPTDPKVTDGKTPYVDTKDPLYSMRNTFNLLQRIALYNDINSTPRVSVAWEWKPSSGEALDDAVMLINQSTDRTASVKISPRTEDVKGSLVAMPYYRLDKIWNGKQEINILDIAGYAKPKVDVTVLGSGSVPSLVPTYKIFPTANGDPVNVPLLSLPAGMPLDVFRRNTEETAFEVGAQLRFGKGYGRAEKVIIKSSKPEAMDIFVDNSSLPYSYNAEIENTDPISGAIDLKFIPKQFGGVTLTFVFMVKDSSGKLVESPQKITTSFTIHDTTPLGYAELSDVVLQSDAIETLGDNNSDINAAYPGGRISYGFKTEQVTYEDIKLPYAVGDKLNITPRIPVGKGINSTIGYRAIGLEGGVKTGSVLDGESFALEGIAVNATVTLSLTVTAQNGDTQQYIFKMTRQTKDSDSALTSFSIKDIKNTELLNNFVTTTYTYDIEVPYGTRWVRPSGKSTSLWAKPLLFDPALVDKDSIASPLPAGDWLRLTYPGDPQAGFNGNKTTVLKATVTAEDDSKTVYTFNITRRDPSTDDRAATIVFKDKDGKEIVFSNDVKFDQETRQYEMRIPYSMNLLTAEVVAADLASLEVGATVHDKATEKKPVNPQGNAVIFALGNELPSPADTMVFDIKIGVWPESGAEPVPYLFRVTRNDPDGDTLLSDLKLQDQNRDPITSFSFNPLTPEYTVAVPYKAESVSVIPTTRSPLARVEIVEGNKPPVKLDKYTTAHTVMLKAGETKTVLVHVYPEDLNADPPYREYSLTLTRAMPSTDARLVSLKVNGGEEFAPMFDPNKTSYKVTMPEGTTSITITAEPKDKAATLLVNGEGAVSGQPSNTITPLEAYSDIPIVVTAEDGKTTMTYTVRVTNRNLIPKSTNADLKSLTINYGDMSPRFKSSITDYEIAVKNDTASVDIIPVPAIAGSTVEVFKGTRKLGDYSNNYSAKLEDGENEFSIKITAEEDKVTKTYDLLVYRKDEEKQGIYKPLTPDMVDYEKDGDIVVDITKYPIISAEVFNTLKTDYPDKNMIFEGNDYSLTLRGKDLEKLIPNEEVFDLSLSFSSPYEDEIWELILNDYRNNKVEPVFIHFNHHGALPAPMVLTMSMGRQYRNMSATWNYYNQERERIDFYGGIKTNARGTFSLRLTHMSTYILSDHQIVGAENKSGEQGTTGGLTSGIDGNKLNPNTGAP